MKLFEIFRSTPEPTREEIRQQHIAEADEAMKVAGQLFDETVNQLSLAKTAVEMSASEAEEMIEYHNEQIAKETETKQKLARRSSEINKVISNVKEMFFFNIDDDE